MTLNQKLSELLKFCGFSPNCDNVLKLCAGVLYCKKKVNIEEYKKLLDINKNIELDQNSYILMINLMYSRIK